jgi:NTE family protein
MRRRLDSPRWTRATRRDAQRRRGLVIGAGGAAGGVWAAGVLCALTETASFPVTRMDVVVGTSAGSVVAALLAADVPPREMVGLLSGRGSRLGSAATISPELSARVRSTLSDIPWPVPFPGNLRLAARTLGGPEQRSMRTAAAALAPRGRGDLGPVGELVGEVCGDRGWPVRPRTWLVAMDFDSGRRVPFGAPGEPVTSAAEAVVASCSVPGLFPPRLIGDRRYVDGGAVSVTNADLLVEEGLDEVIVLAPMVTPVVAGRRPSAARLENRLRLHLLERFQWEVWRLAAAGTRVHVFTPTAEDVGAMGSNWMDPGRHRRVFETAVRTTTSRLASGRARSTWGRDVEGAA